MNDEEYNELLIGMEKAGWPCRLVELPDYYISLAKEVDQLRAEVTRLKDSELFLKNPKKRPGIKDE